MVEIIPSILTEAKEEFLAAYNGLENSVSRIQIDIADGIFVPHITWADPEIIKNTVTCEIELHLMVTNPLTFLEAWKNIPQVKRILIHYETIQDEIAIFLEAMKEYSWEVSLVINTETNPEVLSPYIQNISGIMCMGVIPGFQGKPFIPEVLDTIYSIKQKWPNIFVAIDGGVSLENLPQIIASGVDVICPGSAIFKNTHTPKENVLAFQKQLTLLTL